MKLPIALFRRPPWASFAPILIGIAACTPMRSAGDSGGGADWTVNGGLAGTEQSVVIVEPEAFRASRLFAGPGQFPPADFAAFGIVAFPARASSADRDRHLMLCEEYVAVLPRPDELGLPVEQQMVTVWPVAESSIADDLNAMAEPCPDAVRHYALPAAVRAIRDAGEAAILVGRRGPFLLAWAPGGQKGEQDAVVLMSDLSDVTNAEQARTIFTLWREDIESNPELWESGWDIEALRTGIRLWVDRVGTQIFSVLGA